MIRVELLHITPNAEKVIEAAGRTAYLSFDKETEYPIIQGEHAKKKRIFRAESNRELENLTVGAVFQADNNRWQVIRVWKNSAEKFVEMIVRKGHLSVLEHVNAAFRLTGGSRAFTHQLVRHRMASFTQQSQRYVNENNFRFVEPPSIAGHEEAHDAFTAFMEHARSAYLNLQSMGIKNEDARFVLPNAITSEIVVSADLREWRHIIEVRSHSSAQWEIRQAAVTIFEILSRKIPSAFFDLTLDSKKGAVVKKTTGEEGA